MPQRIEERVRPITPQLAWRVAVLGGIAFVLFGIVFFRLWYLQVLSGDQATSPGAREPRAARSASRRRAATSWTATATRSCSTKRAAVVQIVPSLAAGGRARPGRRVPQGARRRRERRGCVAARPADDAFERQLRDDGRKIDQGARRASARGSRSRRDARARSRSRRAPAGEAELLDRLYRRIGEVLDIRPTTIHERVIRGIADAPYSNVTIRTDVAARPSSTTCASGPEYFPGVVVTKRYLRQYPHGKLAAQLFGTVSEITDEQRKMDERYDGIEQGTRIGQSGLEEQYDKYLRGDRRLQRASSSTRSAAATSSAGCR